MPLTLSSQTRKTTKNTLQTTLDGQGIDSNRAETPATNGPMATANRRAPPKLTTQEIMELTNEVHNVDTGKKYLERTALSIKGKPYTVNTLTETLLHVTQLSGVSLPAVTAIRAVVFIMQEKTNDETAEIIAKLVVASISPQVAKLQEAEEAISKATTELNAKVLAQDSQLTKVQSSVDKLATQVSDSSFLKPSYAETLKTLKTGHSSHQDPAQQSQQIQRLAREAIKERQLLIDFPANCPLAAGKSSHAQLVERVHKALAAIPKEDDVDLEMKAVTQFKQGGMTIEFKTKEAVIYICTNEETKNLLLKNLDPDATIKERTYPVVIPFMPVTFNPTSDTALRTLEDENNWKKGSLTSARWIKPAEKRKSSQQVAHVLINFTEPMEANTAIRDGITFYQLKLWPKKNRREPIRCAKCQHFGHIARECIAKGDTCANCGNNHRSNDCTTNDKNYCTSCETEDHSSWNRDCPLFKKKCDDMDKRYPDNSMPFFPTNEEWTQVAAPPKPAPYRKPAPPPNEQPPPLTQRTLDSYPNRQNHRSGRGGPPSRGFAHNRSPPRHNQQQQTQDFFSTLDYTTENQPIDNWE